MQDKVRINNLKSLLAFFKKSSRVPNVNGGVRTHIMYEYVLGKMSSRELNTHFHVALASRCCPTGKDTSCFSTQSVVLELEI